MAELAKATLLPLERKRAGTKKQPEIVVPKSKPGKPGEPMDAVKVQFNPTSLRLQRGSNHDKGGLNTKAQRRQHPSVQPATLSFDLEFDTAEEEQPNPNDSGRRTKLVDVRTKTKLVRQFVEPPEDKPASAPPRVRFQWGSFIFDGLVTQVNEELDYFDLDGTPLRAKVSVSITEQDLKFEGKRAGPGARDDRAATQPGGQPEPAPGGDPSTDPPAGGTPGRSGTNDVRSLVPAVDGESVQQLAARVGGNPAAWRSLMNGLGSPLALQAGVTVEVGSELEAAETIGRAVGFAAGAGFSVTQELAEVLGLAAAGGPVPAPSGPAIAGQAEAASFALAAAGGIASATAQVLAEAAGRATASARASFAVPPAPGVAAEGELDPRTLTYGRSLPLRARVDLPTQADIEAGGRRSLAARARPAEVPVAERAGGAPWERLPPEAAGRSAASRAQRSRDARPSTIRWRPGGACR
jgi:Contractile injection system tube protein